MCLVVRLLIMVLLEVIILVVYCYGLGWYCRCVFYCCCGMLGRCEFVVMVLVVNV